MYNDQTSVKCDTTTGTYNSTTLTPCARVYVPPPDDTTDDSESTNDSVDSDTDTETTNDATIDDDNNESNADQTQSLPS